MSMKLTGLTLAPEPPPSRPMLAAYDRLRFVGRYDDLWDGIRSLDAQTLPPHWCFMWYFDDGVEERTHNIYGEPLTFVEAGELASLDLPDNLLPWDRGIFAFLKALPPSTRVVLWWH